MGNLLDQAEIKGELEDIEKLSHAMNNPDKRECKDFQELFAWKIRAGDNKARYRLVHLSESDLWKKEGSYFLANLVLQGGGTLGLAHVGLIAGLEQAGVRFSGLAGTSAGSIVSSGVFAIRGPDILKPTARELCEQIASAPFDSFIDAPRPIRILIKQALAGKSIFRLHLLGGMRKILKRLLHRRGLNPGRNFEFWMQGVFEDFGIETVYDMQTQITEIFSDLQAASDLTKAKPYEMMKDKQVLGMNAAGMPIGRKFTFPEEISEFDDYYLKASPAILVRASMSVPVFFEPLKMKVDQDSWPQFIEKTQKGLATNKTLGEFKDLNEVTFLDGGIFSNFPADYFFKEIPSIPTIAVPLLSEMPTTKYRRKASVKGFIEDFTLAANVTRLLRDRDAIDEIKLLKEVWEETSRGTDLPERLPLVLTQINTGNVNFVNFNLSPAEQKDLVLAGVKRAKEFVEKGE